MRQKLKYIICVGGSNMDKTINFFKEIDDKEGRIKEATSSIDELKKKCSNISNEYPDIIR